MSRTNQPHKKIIPKQFSLASTRLAPIFSEIWKPGDSKYISFFPDCNFPTSFFIDDNSETQRILQNYTSASIISLGFMSDTTETLRYIVVCCRNGVSIVDIDVNIEFFLKKISNSTLISTNIENLSQLEGYYGMKLSTKDINSVEGYPDYIKSDRLGPNSKKLLNHQIYNFDPPLTILDVLSLCYSTVAAYHYFTTFYDNNKTAPLPLVRPTKPIQNTEQQPLPMKLIPQTQQSQPNKEDTNQTTNNTTALKLVPSNFVKKQETKKQTISITSLIPNLNTRPQSPPFIPRQDSQIQGQVPNRAQSPPQYLWPTQMVPHHSQSSSPPPPIESSIMSGIQVMKIIQSQQQQKLNETKSDDTQINDITPLNLNERVQSNSISKIQSTTNGKNQTINKAQSNTNDKSQSNSNNKNQINSNNITQSSSNNKIQINSSNKNQSNNITQSNSNNIIQINSNNKNQSNSNDKTQTNSNNKTQSNPNNKNDKNAKNKNEKVDDFIPKRKTNARNNPFIYQPEPNAYQPQQLINKANNDMKQRQHAGSPPGFNYCPSSPTSSASPPAVQITDNTSEKPYKRNQGNSVPEPMDWKPQQRSAPNSNQPERIKSELIAQKPSVKTHDQRMKCPLCKNSFGDELLVLNHIITQHGYSKQFDESFRYVKDGLTCLLCHQQLKCFDAVIDHVASNHYQKLEDLILSQNKSENVKKFMVEMKNKVQKNGKSEITDSADTRLKDMSVQTDSPEEVFDETYFSFIASSINTEGIQTEKIELSKVEPIEIEMIQEKVQTFETPVDANFWRQLDMLELLMRATNQASFDANNMMCKICNKNCKSCATLLSHCYEHHRDLLDTFD